MDIPRTDSPVCGFEFPSSAPLTRPSPGWIRALPPSGVAPDAMPESDEHAHEHDLCSEAEADLASLVHHLDLSIYSNPPSLRFSLSLSSRASCSSEDSLSTIGYTPRSSILHTPTSSMDFNQFNPRAVPLPLPKSRSLASVALSPSARRAAVYIVDDEDVEEAYGAAKISSYGMEVDQAEEGEEEELHDNPPSRFSMDEEERPLTGKRDIWTRSRTVSMTAAPIPFPRSSPSYPPSPPPPTPRRSKRKTLLSMLHLAS